MSEISGDFKLGFNLHQMKQGANDRFKAADIDGNEVVSKKEFSDFMEQRGFDTNKTNKIFNRVDGNGDGQISQNEHQDMISFMEQRMGLMTGEAGSKQGFDVLKSLLESLQNESHRDDKKQRLQDVLERVGTL